MAFIAMRAPEGKCKKSLWGVIFSDSLGRNYNSDQSCEISKISRNPSGGHIFHPSTRSRLATCEGSRHPQGWSERKQVFIISCEVESELIVSSWILTCAANRDIIQMWRTHTRSRFTAYVLLLYGLLVVRRCMSCCSMIITPPMNVFSLQSCEARNWFDVECKLLSAIGC